MAAESAESAESAERPCHVLLVGKARGDIRLIEETLKDVSPCSAEGPVTGSDGVVLSHVETLTAGIDRLDAGDVDVLLLDLELPGSSGIETLVRIRKETDDVPIVVLTGQPEGEIGVEAIAHGAQECLVKDAVTPEILDQAIGYAIERKRSDRASRRRTEEIDVLSNLTQHDVRNDVGLIVGRARELREEVDQGTVQLVDEILSASNHIRQLTRSVETVGSAIRNGETADRRPVNLWRVVRTEAETARSLYDDAIVDIEIDESNMAIEVQANELLSSVFANLLGNSLRYNDKETPKVSISIAVGEEVVTTRIADNGPGVPEYRRSRLFDVSSDDPGTKPSTGLYIVGRLVDQYGGNVIVENREECGATFVVTLPLA